jgi:hypothetical protein
MNMHSLPRSVGVFCLVVAFGAVSLLGLPGCGEGKSSGMLKGKVTYPTPNDPAGRVKISFLAANGSTMGGTQTEADGTYSVPLPPGEYTVTISSVAAPNPGGMIPSTNPEQMKQQMKKMGKSDEEIEKMLADQKQGVEGSSVQIPMKYSDPKQSGLKATIKAGSNEQNFNLS